MSAAHKVNTAAIFVLPDRAFLSSRLTQDKKPIIVLIGTNQGYMHMYIQYIQAGENLNHTHHSLW